MRIDLKNKKVNLAVTVLLAGLLILIVLMPVKSGTDKLKSSNDESGEKSESRIYYEEYYEKKLKDILEKSYGENTMEVMVTISVTGADGLYGDSEEKVSIEGVLIIAHVSDSQAVSDITFAVCALFGLPACKVGVILN